MVIRVVAGLLDLWTQFQVSRDLQPQSQVCSEISLQLRPAAPQVSLQTSIITTQRQSITNYCDQIIKLSKISCRQSGKHALRIFTTPARRVTLDLKNPKGRLGRSLGRRLSCICTIICLTMRHLL